MPTLYPGSNDAFSVPSAPTTTSLSSDGGSGRAHTQHHQDLGDAVVALETNAALLTHDHSGTGSRPTSKLAQANTHQSPDTDTATTALHHTLGTGAFQAAAGNHTHDYNGSSILNRPYFICTSTTRPGSPTTGMTIFETDTGCIRLYGTFAPAVTPSWRLLPWGNKPRMRATQGVVQNLPVGGAGTYMEWHTEQEDTFGGFNAATSLTNFYISEPGLYRVKYEACLSTQWFADNATTGIRLNGSPITGNPLDRSQYVRGAGLFNANAGNVQSVPNEGDVRCSANDYISVWIQHSGVFNQLTGGIGTPFESHILIEYKGL